MSVTEGIENSAVRRGRILWHDGGSNPPSLGCTKCPDLDACGGLRIAAALYSCLDLCRCPPRACRTDAVCRRNPAAFATRFNEVGGFELDDVARVTAARPAPAMPVTVPVIYHGRSRKEAFFPEAAAVSLYDVVSWKDGSPRHPLPTALRTHFGLGPDVPLVLSGTATDPAIERWWSHQAPRRRAAIAELREAAGAVLVTAPNYSLFRDMPRWDDLHSIKRIAMAWAEFAEGGIPAAPHLNARTDRDYERWARFLSDRPEITHVAFEFGTAAGQPGRREWHAARLEALAGAIGRPLHLLVRGGLQLFARLETAFGAATLIDTNAFMKTMMRRRLEASADASLSEEPCPTSFGEPLDELFDQNALAMRAAVVAATRAPGHLSGRAPA